MSSSVIGKTCPFCLFPIKQEAEALLCQDCLVPHHRECWDENRGCTTFGCGCKETGGRPISQDSVEITLDPREERPSERSSNSAIAFVVIALAVVFAVFAILHIRPTLETPTIDATAAGEQQAAAQGNPQTGEEVFFVITRQDKNLFIRKSPGRENKSSGDIITRVPRGTKVELVNDHGDSVRRDGYTWWEIMVMDNGVKGWAAAEYLSARSDDVYGR